MSKFYDIAHEVKEDLGISEIPSKKYLIQRLNNPRINQKFIPICNKLITDFGYESLALENLNFYEQCLAFRSAKVIIGPHGAGLSNMLMGSKRTKFIELNSFLDNEQYLRPWFYLLAEGVGQKYAYINTSQAMHSESIYLDGILKFED
jgi:hypothetical protein